MRRLVSFGSFMLWSLCECRSLLNWIINKLKVASCQPDDNYARMGGLAAAIGPCAKWMDTSEKKAALELLRLGRWFGSLPSELQELILDHCLVRRCSSGQVLVVEDTNPVGMFAVLEGQVAITRQIGTDHDFFIHLCMPGFWFAETGLFNRRYAGTTVTCRSPCRLLLLPIAGFDRIVEQQPDYYRRFTELYVDRYAVLFRLLGQARFLSPREFLRVRLADLVDINRLKGSEGQVAELVMTHADVGNLIGTARQTAGRLLEELEAEGLIERAFRTIRIPDTERLRGRHSKTGL